MRQGWDFTVSLRCGDPWYNRVLSQCRRGDLSVEAYRFLNGFPTASPALLGSAGSAAGDCECHGQCDNDGFYSPWSDAFLNQGLTSTELVSRECKACADERMRRMRVIDKKKSLEEIKKAPFDRAPFLAAHNVPKYYTMMQRSRQYAHTNGLRLSWSFAKDLPLHREDRDLGKEQLDAKKGRFLKSVRFCY